MVGVVFLTCERSNTEPVFCKTILFEVLGETLVKLDVSCLASVVLVPTEITKYVPRHLLDKSVLCRGDRHWQFQKTLS